MNSNYRQYCWYYTNIQWRIMNRIDSIIYFDYISLVIDKVIKLVTIKYDSDILYKTDM